MPAQLADRPIQIPSRMRQGANHLGLDFGTHSTKAILRVRDSERPVVLFLDEPISGYPVYSSPSLVRLSSDERLFFGSEALLDRGGQLFRSLKISLLPPGAERGQQSVFPSGVGPELLVSLYLSWVLRRIRTALNAEESRFTLNVAAPMNHLEDEVLRNRYQRVIHAAWQATFGPDLSEVYQGVPLSQVQGRFDYLLSRPLPPSGMQRFAVKPETLAPLVSLSRQPNFSAGFYMMIDMGAGTTEISVSYLGQHSADQCIWCYEDESFLLGGDQFDNNDLSNAASPNEHAIEENRLRDQLRTHWLRVWHCGFHRDMNWSLSSREQWRRLGGLLSGGALRRADLQELILQSRPHDTVFATGLVPYEVEWHNPEGLDFGEQLPQDGTDCSCPAFLAVANGLALESPHWPQFIYPPDVPALGDGRRATQQHERGYSESDVG